MEALGVLILHGFTSGSDSVHPLALLAERRGIPYRMPLLRGHGTRPEDLRGVTWPDWYADAAAGYADLRQEARQVLIAGLSMGGLLALHLASARPADTAGVVTIGAALRFWDQRALYAHWLAPLIPMWGSEDRDMGLGWANPEVGRTLRKYRRFPAAALASLVRYTAIVERKLPAVQAPLLVLHSHADRTIPPEAARIVYERAGAQEKELVWFERSGHEMLRDSEAEAVLERIAAFILARQAALGAASLAAKE